MWEAQMSKCLTVLQTLPALNSGGVERGTLEIARALVANGHRSIVVSSGGALVEQLIAEGSEHVTMPVHKKSLMSLFEIRAFRQMLQKINPDIVHARSRIPAWIAWLALRKMNPATRPRFVTTVHGMYSVSPYSAIMTKGERVIAISQSVLEYIQQNYPGCPKERIQLIYRGADTVEFSYGLIPSSDWLIKWQSMHPQLSDKIILGLAGRLAPIKGHITFLHLIKELAPEHPNIHGLIIGGAEPARANYELELKQLVVQMELTNHISFTGHRDDMAEVLTQCHLLFSLRTTPEAFGRSTLEPLRIGKPVIGWNEGGVGEILNEIYPFGTVKAHDFNELISKTKIWLKDQSTPQATNKFLLSTMCSETIATYLELTNQ